MLHNISYSEGISKLLLDLPLYPNQSALRQGRYKVDFHRENPSRFGILPRYGSPIVISATPSSTTH